MVLLSPVEQLCLILVVVLLEVALFWAAAALGDAPPLSWGKMFLVSFLASAACAVVGGAIDWSLPSIALLAPENRLLAAVIGLLALLVSWVIPGGVYAPLIPVSIPRGMLISVVQMLMRIFLYVMILAIGMVVLAVWQIIHGSDARAEILVPVLSHALNFCNAMILEGIVTTTSSDGTINIAPMGPRLDAPYVLEAGSRFSLRPFKTARTFANLEAHPEGVFHVSDDVLLLARAAVGPIEPLPLLKPAETIRGWVLAEACRACEFRVVSLEAREERATFLVEVRKVHQMRDFFGFNRAMHAVLEAAILATRTSFLALAEIEAEYERLGVLVAKTGGPREQEAFAFLQQYIKKGTTEAQRHREDKDSGGG